ncbi:hypothetical protein AURDEDRAFT_161017 [Auricularia subglabra TFB-10046 SS5]|nr:hypothetical protein AURDEDRAFT_161017 [Auricularia subglabra TFB-10046 SS5]
MHVLRPFSAGMWSYTFVDVILARYPVRDRGRAIGLEFPSPQRPIWHGITVPFIRVKRILSASTLPLWIHSRATPTGLPRPGIVRNIPPQTITSHYQGLCATAKRADKSFPIPGELFA